MRRILYISMILTLLFSCDSKDIIDHTPTPTPQPESSRPIEMSATTDWYGATKAPVTNVTEIETAGFVVWGVCIDSEDTEITETDIFGSAGTLVTHDDEKGWGYSPLKYWHEGTSKFMAITPAMEYTMTDLPYESTDNGLKLEVTFPDGGFNLSDTQSDLMVAYSDETYDGKTLPGTVSMQFKHQLSLVNIQFMKEDASIYKIKNLRIYGNSTMASSAVFAAERNTNGQVEVTPEWTLITPSDATTPYRSWSNETEITATTSESATNYVSNLLVFPEETTITIAGTYVETVASGTLERSFSVPVEVNWEAKQKYTYLFKLNSYAIVLGQPTVEDWEDGGAADGSIEM